MQSYEHVVTGIKRYLTSDILPMMSPGVQVAVGVGARYILANPDKVVDALMAQFPVLGMLGAVDKASRTVDVEGIAAAAFEQAKEIGGFKIPLGAQQLTIPPEDIDKIKQYIMQGGV